MPKFSQQFLSQLGSQGLFGESLMNATDNISTFRKRQAETKGVQEELRKYANNPAQLNAMAQKYQAMGKADIAKAFYEAAKQATAAKADKKAKISDLETAGQDIKKEAQAKVQLQKALQVADKRGDEDALVALRAKALDPVDYLKGTAASPETPEYSYSSETIVRDGKEVRIRVGVNKNDPTDIVTKVLGDAVPTGGSGSKKTLEQQLEDAGVTDFNLDTMEGLKKARKDVIRITGNASLSNSITNMIEEATPMGIGETFTLLRETDPAFSQAEADLERVEKFEALTELTGQDVSGLRNIIERVVSGTTESDIKAVQELQAFRGNKDIINKLNDFVLGVTSGRLSPETVNEYQEVMTVLGALAKQRQISTINKLIVDGSPKEQEAALKAKRFITGNEGARILP